MPRTASAAPLWPAAMLARSSRRQSSIGKPTARSPSCNKRLKLRANQVPLEMLETRAVTPAPGEVQENQAAIEPYVFPGSVAEFLQIPRPTVDVGEAIYPTLTGETTVHSPAKNAAAGETTGEFTAEKLSPARLQASFFYSREDAASFASMGDSLRANLVRGACRMAWTGKSLSAPMGCSRVRTWRTSPPPLGRPMRAIAGRKLAYDHIDGRYANLPGDLRVVVGSGDLRRYCRFLRQPILACRSALEGLTTPSVLAGLRVSAHVAAVDGDDRQLAIDAAWARAATWWLRSGRASQ